MSMCVYVCMSVCVRGKGVVSDVCVICTCMYVCTSVCMCCEVLYNCDILIAMVMELGVVRRNHNSDLQLSSRIKQEWLVEY